MCQIRVDALKTPEESKAVMEKVLARHREGFAGDLYELRNKMLSEMQEKGIQVSFRCRKAKRTTPAVQRNTKQPSVKKEHQHDDEKEVDAPPFMFEFFF